MSAAATTSAPAMTATPAIARQRIVRYTYATLGVVFLAIALIGIPVPGIPTTGPLLASMFFMTRSCPRLQEYVLRWRVLRPYLVYLDGNAPIPGAARICAIAIMWLAILISSLIWFSRDAGALVPACLIAAGALGTAVIGLWRRRPRSRAPIALHEAA
jgi:uncharacterized membrane protein YbaN (DUF454 family)